MKIAYLYNRDVSEGEAMGCERTFADWKNTNRAELIALMDKGGLVKGDTLCVRAVSDLGQGAEAKRHQKKLADMGVALEVIPGAETKRVKGRPSRLKPTPEQRTHLCELWYSPATVEHVLNRAGDIMGADVDRNRMNYWCGPRDGSAKSTKLK